MAVLLYRIEMMLDYGACKTAAAVPYHEAVQAPCPRLHVVIHAGLPYAASSWDLCPKALQSQELPGLAPMSHCTT